jgi:hypothetical protein
MMRTLGFVFTATLLFAQAAEYPWMTGAWKGEVTLQEPNRVPMPVFLIVTPDGAITGKVGEAFIKQVKIQPRSSFVAGLARYENFPLLQIDLDRNPIPNAAVGTAKAVMMLKPASGKVVIQWLRVETASGSWSSAKTALERFDPPTD